MEKNQKIKEVNLELIKKILGIYQKLVLLILIIYFGSNQKYWSIDKRNKWKLKKSRKKKKIKQEIKWSKRGNSNLKYSLNFYFMKYNN